MIPAQIRTALDNAHDNRQRFTIAHSHFLAVAKRHVSTLGPEHDRQVLQRDDAYRRAADALLALCDELTGT